MARGIEKRKFHRLDVPLAVCVDVESSEDLPARVPSFQTESRNISRNGICLETRFVEVGGVHLLAGPPGARENRLHMKISLFPEEPPFLVTGEVCWYDVDCEVDENIYRLGVEFLDIAEQGKGQLLRFLKIHKNREGFLSLAAEKLLHCIRPQNKPEGLQVVQRVSGPF
ncbi:MAG TPA: PilZ domain-containing protein [Syntrophales bacterium]|jgi:c-di-GMP-binding flagellar brake protein YcgR|nr:PilZ domain-containing protein [Syntrophales bacterium]